MAASILAAGRAALRRFYRPFVLIQLLAVALIVAYHLSAHVRAVCAVLAAAKVAGGLPFVAAVGAVSGGLLPELAKALTERRAPALMWGGRAGEIAFNVAFFAFNAVMIDGLYRGEAVLFGDDGRLGTVAAKTAFDQLLFTPLWMVVVRMLFLWREAAFSWMALRPQLGRGFYRARVLPLLIPSWLFWFPMVLIIYALPVPLQFLLFALALAAWSLIMVVIARS